MSVEVLITSSKKNGRKVVVKPESLKFVAKGYSTGNVLFFLFSRAAFIANYPK